MILLKSVLLSLAVTQIWGQCPFTTDCKTCLSNRYCYFFVKCEICSTSTNACSESPITSPNNCVANRSWPTVTQLATSRSSIYGVLGIGLAAIIILTIISYSPIEEICGLKVTPTFNGFGCTSYMLSFASCFLWLGLSLSLATPSLPWLASFTPTNDYQQNVYFASAFMYEFCVIDNDTLEIATCPSAYVFSEIVSSSTSSVFSSAFSSTEFSYFRNALLLGAFGYVTTIGLLFPCAVMSSIALYRYNRYIKYGIPAYTAGCSLASLSVAQMLGWPSFIIFIIVIGCGVQLAATVVKVLSVRAFPDIQFFAMPGSVAAGVSIFMQLLGLILVSISSRALRNVKGVGCNSGGCCRLAIDAYEDEDEGSSKQVKVAYERSSLLRS